MKNSVFRHITRWDKSHVLRTLNKDISTNWSESYYWKNKKNYKIQKPIHDRNFNRVMESFDSSLINKNLECLRNSLLSLINDAPHSKYNAEVKKENIFEDVRLKEFPNLPSRKNCMFLIPNEVNLERYSENMGFDINDAIVLNIEVSNNSFLHYADMSLLNCNLFADDYIEIQAKRYWNGVENEHININTEILFRGNFKIISIA